ncbi:MAG: hypothetical protein HY343_07670 [Lentisphaerae bacterium]|nr:hypothetical protein [Lentisphaerota bacterium]
MNIMTSRASSYVGCWALGVGCWTLPRLCRGLALILFLGLSASRGPAEPVKNGNDLALAFSTGTPVKKAEIQKSTTNTLTTFRYLKVTEILKDTPEPGVYRLTSVEPSSDMIVVLTVAKPLSVKLADTLQTNDCVAANGRIKSFGVVSTNRIVLDPATLSYKDKPAPKDGRKGVELLNEIDPKAK